MARGRSTSGRRTPRSRACSGTGSTRPSRCSTEDSPEQFRLTDDGAARARVWWDTAVGREKPGRDELAIKLALAVTVPGVDVAAVVRRQRDETLRALRALTRQKRDLDPRADLAHSLVLESQVFAAEAEVRWLDHVEASVAAYAPAPKDAASRRSGTTTKPTRALTKENTR